MLPITATQFGVNRLLEQSFATAFNRQPGELEHVASAAVAGATSAFIACAAEMIMIQQQKNGRSLGTEARQLVSTYGIAKLYKGIVRSAFEVVRACLNIAAVY